MRENVRVFSQTARGRKHRIYLRRRELESLARDGNAPLRAESGAADFPCAGRAFAFYFLGDLNFINPVLQPRPVEFDKFDLPGFRHAPSAVMAIFSPRRGQLGTPRLCAIGKSRQFPVRPKKNLL